MFESNFPVDKRGVSYRRAVERVQAARRAGASPARRRRCSGTRCRAYRLEGLALAMLVRRSKHCSAMRASVNWSPGQFLDDPAVAEDSTRWQRFASSSYSAEAMTTTVPAAATSAMIPQDLLARTDIDALSGFMQ